MFQTIEQHARPRQRFLLHCLLVIFCVPIAGLLNYMVTPWLER